MKVRETTGATHFLSHSAGWELPATCICAAFDATARLSIAGSRSVPTALLSRSFQEKGKSLRECSKAGPEEVPECQIKRQVCTLTCELESAASWSQTAGQFSLSQPFSSFISCFTPPLPRCQHSRVAELFQL